MNDELKQTILTELDLQDLDTQSQEAVISDVGETILRQILLDSSTSLSKETQEKFLTAIETGDMETAFTTLDENIPDFESLAKESAKKVITSLKEE